MKIAIVGSEDKYWNYAQKARATLKIRELLDNISYHTGMMNMIMVSGGCPKGGIDIWAEVVADSLGIKKEIYLPEVNQWEDQYVCVNGNKSIQTKLIGYESRNIQIAEACDVLYCIDPKGRKWSGGRWTMREAEKLGKEVHLVEID